MNRIIPLIRMINIIHKDNNTQYPIHPLEKYVMNFEYPQIIKDYGYLSDDILFDKLLKFKKDLLKNNKDAIDVIDELSLKSIQEKDLIYYFIISDNYKSLNKHTQEIIDSLFDIKLEESKKIIREYSYHLDLSLRIKQTLTLLDKEEIKCLNKVKKINEKDYQKALKLIEKASLIEIINQYKPQN